MFRSLRVLALTLLFLSTATHAINKCTGADGSVSYTDSPCPAGAHSQSAEKTVSSGGSALCGSLIPTDPDTRRLYCDNLQRCDGGDLAACMVYCAANVVPGGGPDSQLCVERMQASQHRTWKLLSQHAQGQGGAIVSRVQCVSHQRVVGSVAVRTNSGAETGGTVTCDANGGNCSYAGDPDGQVYGSLDRAAFILCAH